MLMIYVPALVAAAVVTPTLELRAPAVGFLVSFGPAAWVELVAGLSRRGLLLSFYSTMLFCA